MGHNQDDNRSRYVNRAAAVDLSVFLWQRWVAEELQTVLGRRSTGREDQTVQHPLPLASAYEAVTGEEAAFSTSHGKATAGKTVDYVWFRPLVSSNTLLLHHL